MGNVQKRVVAVVGSRSVTSCPAMLARLDALLAAGELHQVVSGGAVDAGVGLLEMLPDYRAHGPAAPLVRNGTIVAAADVVLVVWDGQSRGTLDAARKAAKLGKRVEWLGAPAPSAAPVPGGLGL